MIPKPQTFDLGLLLGIANFDVRNDNMIYLGNLKTVVLQLYKQPARFVKTDSEKLLAKKGEKVLLRFWLHFKGKKLKALLFD